jgi:hypothetical protein
VTNTTLGAARWNTSMVFRSSSIFPSFDTGVTGGGMPSVGGGFTLAVALGGGGAGPTGGRAGSR